MVKRKANSQSANLTFDHKNLRKKGQMISNGLSNMELESSRQKLQDNLSQMQNKLEQKKHKVKGGGLLPIVGHANV
jgi:hypothetical protein